MHIPERSVSLDPLFRAVITGDTHVRQGRPALPSRLRDELAKSGSVFHTGDFCDLATYEELSDSGPLYAVSGNNDDTNLAGEIPNRLRIYAGSRTILLTHGHLERGSGAKKAVQAAYAGREEIVIFGHSHQPCWEEVKGTWFLNPGSPTMRRREPEFSFAILEIDDDHTLDVSFVTF